MQRGFNFISTWLWVFKNAKGIMLWDLKRQTPLDSRKEEASGGSASVVSHQGPSSEVPVS